jgi:Kelch motif
LLHRIHAWAAGALLILFFGAVPRADAQTRTLIIHGSGPLTISGTALQCNILQVCGVAVNDGATVRLSAADASSEANAGNGTPGNFSGGTGPAAGCALSTCTITMTADAEVTVGPAPGAPVVYLTMTAAGDGGGVLRPDGIRLLQNPRTIAYLQGSSVELDAEPAGAAGFGGYSSGTGDAAECGGASHCTFTINSNSSVTGTFLALEGFFVTQSSAFGTPGGPPATFSATGIYSGDVTGIIPGGKGAWSTAPSLPFTLQSLAAAGLSGRIYALGGKSISFDPNAIGNGLWAFDPTTQAWTTRAPMFVRRERLSATTAGGLLYAIGGSDNTGTLLASMERYDPGTNTWTMLASMSAPRLEVVAGSVNGIVYAAGGLDAGGTPVATLEAYDPATNTWTSRAPVPTPRARATGGVVNGILYVVGGRIGTSSVPTVEAYDPATNTWAARAPMPGFLGASAAAVADGVLYVISGGASVYAYDPVADSWSARAPLGPVLGGARFGPAAASLNGVVYAMGGQHGFPACCNRALNVVETFVDSLRWSSSQPDVARIDQNGSATPLAPGTTTIVANVGGQTCGANCGSFSVVGPSDLELNGPSNGSVLNAPFTVIGWALNTAAPSGTGVDAVHVYAFPSGGGAGIFIGVATYGLSRPDVGAIFGSQFTNSGFSLTGGGSLAPGPYTLAIYGRNALLETFDVVRTVNITIAAPVSNPFIDLDTPREGLVVTSSFEVVGWALDLGSPTGTGVDTVQFYVFPNNGASPGVFMGTGTYGLSRPDVAAFFGDPRFTNTGFHFSITGLGPGAYLLGVYGRSTVTGTFSVVKTIHFTVNATALMAANPPEAEAVITSPSFIIGGWSIDRSVESTLQSGTGVDALHVYAYPNPGSGEPPIFLGVAGYGYSRPDVAALYGSRYDPSGFYMTVIRADMGLIPGVYLIAVHSHSSVTGTFNTVAVVRVTLQ